MIIEIIDKSGRKIHLTEERWKHISKHLRVIVNYLNGDGFIVTAHFVEKIQ